VKQGEALSSLLFKFATRKAQDDREGMKLNGTPQLLPCAHVNLLGEKMNVWKIKTPCLALVRKRPEINAHNIIFLLLVGWD
jgi:hypothetical protein